MEAADDRGRVAIERDVYAVALEALLELLRGELLGALLDRLLERPAGLVRGLPGGRSFARRQIGNGAQQVG